MHQNIRSTATSTATTPAVVSLPMSSVTQTGRYSFEHSAAANQHISSYVPLSPGIKYWFQHYCHHNSLVIVSGMRKQHISISPRMYHYSLKSKSYCCASAFCCCPCLLAAMSTRIFALLLLLLLLVLYICLLMSSVCVQLVVLTAVLTEPFEDEVKRNIP